MPVHPRLLLLVNAFEADAPTRLMLEVARAAQESGRFECHMAALSRGGPLKEEAGRLLAGAHCLDLGGVRSVLQRGRLVSFCKMLAPGIVHVSLLRPTLLGVGAARAAGVPEVMVTCHGTHEWGEAFPFPEHLIRAFYRHAVNRTDCVVGVSCAVTDELRKAGVAGGLVRQVNNGVDPEQFRPLPRNDGRAVAGWTHGKRLHIGAAGNLRAVKGFHTLVEAVAILPEERRSPDVLQVSIWGEGPERQRLQELAAGHGVDGLVRLEGQKSDMLSCFRSCDLYVQPSLREAFGLAAAEAMACGLPVITSDAGGLPDLAGRGEAAAGLTFPAGSAKDLASCILRLMENPQEAQTLALNARPRVLERFTLDGMKRGYLELYDELTAQAGRK